MTEATKKITYTSEFKLKVLDYYFKNGGDENFGLKKKTASHFNINKKTINRQVSCKPVTSLAILFMVHVCRRVENFREFIEIDK